MPSPELENARAGSAPERRAANAGAPWQRTELLTDSRNVSLPDALITVAELVPDRLSLVDPHGSLTYRELVAEMRRVARAVPRTDRPSEEPVVVTAGHGIVPLVQFLAVLQAGRIVLPVDVREPVARLTSVYQSAGASAVLTSGVHAAVARELAGDDPVVVHEAITETSTAPLAPVDPDQIATIFYTSGSTGTPKGVYEDHRAAVGNNVSFAWSLGFNPDDRVALTSSYAFAAMRTRFLGGLLSGATVCTFDLTGEGVRRLPDFVTRNQVSVLWCTPTVLRALNDVPLDASLTSVRLVTFGSETLFGLDVRRARARFADSTVFLNRLSSSEAHAIALYEIPLDGDDGPVPVGTPAPWADITLVDEDGQPVADGEAGRIDVVAPHCALGYWRDPELTAEKFFTLPDGRRGFHSSDGARLRPDGLLEHVGRLDDRVKVRGAMVSPSEVETALTHLPDVAVAAVVAGRVDDGDMRLVGYVQPELGATPSAWEVRRALGELVPTHMVPNTIVITDAIPRTPRGKLDRAALAPPAESRTPYRAPESLERPLAELFEETLGVIGIGADDDFFELGGDSLAAVELLAAVEEQFGVDLGDRDLLDAPTVALLAPRLARRRPATASPLSAVRRATAPGALPFFCVPGGGDPASSLASLARALDDRAVYGFQSRGLEERALPDRSVGAVARRYLRELRALRPQGPYLLGGYSFGGLVAFEMACRLEAAGAPVALLVILDTPGPDERPGRSERVSARADLLRSGDDEDPATGRVAVARRAATFAVSSAAAHAERGMTLVTAGIVPRAGVAQYRLFFRLSRRLARNYKPKQRFGGDTLIVRATERVDHQPRDLGWAGYLSGAVDYYDAPGTHQTLHRSPNVQSLGKRLAEAFDARR